MLRVVSCGVVCATSDTTTPQLFEDLSVKPKDVTNSVPGKVHVSGYSVSNPWLVNFNVRLFSVTARTI